jgi:hypothetical protein
MSKHAGIRLAECAVVAWTLQGATVLAQPPPNVSRTGLSISASAGIVGAGHTSSDRGYGPTFTASVDVPVLHGWDVRVWGGRLHWHSGRDWFPGSPYPGRVSLDHVNVTVVRHYRRPRLHDPAGVYFGMGAGRYRYRIEHGRFTNPDSAGLHVLGGIEYQKFNRNIGYRLEFQAHVTGGPNHPHIRTDMMSAMSISAGVTRRF